MQRASLIQRTATAADKDLLFRAYACSREGEFHGTDWPQDQLNAFLKMQFDLREQVYGRQFPQAATYVLEYENDPAAMYIADRSEAVTRLVDIVVLPEFQGRNIGTEIIRRLLAEGKPVVLSVESSNISARRLYERLGFEITDDGDDVYHRMRCVPK
jgi:ribosomal protein S18 acetylase RimI-like enzyme